MREVTIHGPNLRDQSKGQFVVHDSDCRDNQRVRHIFGGYTVESMERPWRVEVETKADATYYIYEDQINEGADFESCNSDLWWCPCCADVPEGEERIEVEGEAIA